MRILALVLAGAVLLVAVGSDEIPFRKHTVDIGRSETCAVADVNRDGPFLNGQWVPDGFLVRIDIKKPQ